jgi:hypothetical protein
VGQGQGAATNANPFTAPPVPGGKGGGQGTSVDTPSMTVFANNINALIDPVLKARAALEPIAVAPGTFYHADQIRTKINGDNGDAGLKAQYSAALEDLHKGLADLHDGVQTLAQKYKTIDDANGMKAQDLSNAMDKPTSDFGAMLQDTGGSPVGPSSGGGSGGDSSTSGGSSGGGNGSSTGGSGGNTSSGGSSGTNSQN